MERTSKIELLCIGISFCVTHLAWGQQKTISQDGVSLSYETAMFTKVKIVELKKEPLPNPRDRLNVHPANLLFLFYKNSQYTGSIELYPLQDWSVKELMKYLRQMEKFLDEKSESTFQPSLTSIQALVGSLRFENVDAADWGSKFSGKTIVIEK